MRNLLKTLLVVMLVSLSVCAQAQKMSKEEKKAQKAREKKELAERDAQNHRIALSAIESNQWAFQTDALYDGTGARINTTSNQPNFAGFDGTKFFALIIMGSKLEGGSGLKPYSVDSNGKFESKKIDKKGNYIYKFISYAPTRSEAILTLYKGSDAATLYISVDAGSFTYNGKAMPIGDCWYFLTSERRGTPTAR